MSTRGYLFKNQVKFSEYQIFGDFKLYKIFQKYKNIANIANTANILKHVINCSYSKVTLFFSVLFTENLKS